MRREWLNRLFWWCLLSGRRVRLHCDPLPIQRCPQVLHAAEEVKPVIKRMRRKVREMYWCETFYRESSTKCFVCGSLMWVYCTVLESSKKVVWNGGMLNEGEGEECKSFIHLGRWMRNVWLVSVDTKPWRGTFRYLKSGMWPGQSSHHDATRVSQLSLTNLAGAAFPRKHQGGLEGRPLNLRIAAHSLEDWHAKSPIPRLLA